LRITGAQMFTTTRRLISGELVPAGMRAVLQRIRGGCSASALADGRPDAVDRTAPVRGEVERASGPICPPPAGNRSGSHPGEGLQPGCGSLRLRTDRRAASRAGAQAPSRSDHPADERARRSHSSREPAAASRTRSVNRESARWGWRQCVTRRGFSPGGQRTGSTTPSDSPVVPDRPFRRRSRRVENRERMCTQQESQHPRQRNREVPDGRCQLPIRPSGGSSTPVDGPGRRHRSISPAASVDEASRRGADWPHAPLSADAGANAGKLVDRLALRFPKTPRDHIASTVAEEYAALRQVHPHHIPNLVEHGGDQRLRLLKFTSGYLRLTRDPTAAARAAAGAKHSITSTGTAAATTPAHTAVHNYFVNSGQRSPEHSRLTTGAAIEWPDGPDAGRSGHRQEASIVLADRFPPSRRARVGEQVRRVHSTYPGCMPVL
jgi:hypothetical protein